jgi:hypothetical protein
VDSAILILLGATAFVLLQERRGRAGLEVVRQLAEDAISDRPYIVVWQHGHWDLRDRDTVVVTKTEQIRFTRNDVATNFQWSSGPGEVRSTTAKWRRGRTFSWIPARKVHEFATRGGVKEIYCFDEEHSRGDMLDWCVEREIVGQFPDAHEGIEVTARTKSDHPRVYRITWPAGSPPSHVEIRRGAEPARPLITRTKEGRPYIEERVSGLSVGEALNIDWTW